MILPFERWVKEQDFDGNAKKLFEEAMICYKSNAYRAALMLSYLAFMTALKRRILVSEAPTGFSLAEWLNNYQKKVQSEEAWDKNLFEFTQQRAPKKIVFDISEDLREQIAYWKNRRNDCAHAKDNEISHSHLEMFWLFLQSNLSKLFVGGGSAHLKERIQIHFDPSLTPLQADYSSIISDIQHAIPRKEMQLFFAEVESIIRGLLGGVVDSAKNRHLEFFEKVFLQSPPLVADELAKFLKSDRSKLEDFLYYYPNRIGQMNLSKEFIRSFWHNGSGYLGYRAIKIILAMLRNNLIPSEEREELANDLLKFGHFGELTHEESTNLTDMGFFKRFHEKFLASGQAIGDFNLGNRLTPLLIHYLETFPIEKEIVQVLCTTLNLTYYPYNLHEAVKSFHAAKPAKLQEFQAIMSAHNIATPQNSIV